MSIKSMPTNNRYREGYEQLEKREEKEAPVYEAVIEFKGDTFRGTGSTPEEAEEEALGIVRQMHGLPEELA